MGDAQVYYLLCSMYSSVLIYNNPSIDLGVGRGRAGAVKMEFHFV